MANNSGHHHSLFGDSIHNLPDFVQKLSADSITPGRRSVLIDSYGSASTTSGTNVTESASSFSPPLCSGMSLPISVPTPVLESTSKTAGDDVKSKIKVGKSIG